VAIPPTEAVEILRLVGLAYDRRLLDDSYRAEAVISFLEKGSTTSFFEDERERSTAQRHRSEQGDPREEQRAVVPEQNSDSCGHTRDRQERFPEDPDHVPVQPQL